MSEQLAAAEAARTIPTIRIRLASTRTEREAAFALRRAVFCVEQGLFGQDDRDEVDPVALPIAAVLDIEGEAPRVVGTVRIHEAQPGLWFGSRLAVARDMRRGADIGTGLIRLAVGVAHAHGCQTFLAHVQQQNVVMFERLHWKALQALDLHGRPHQLMQADLAHYPAIRDGDTGLVVGKGITCTAPA